MKIYCFLMGICNSHIPACRQAGSLVFVSCFRYAHFIYWDEGVKVKIYILKLNIGI